MNKPVLVLALLIGVSGCSSSYYYNWSKPRATVQDFTRDNFECKQLSQETILIPMGGTFAGGPVVNEQTWLECLAARGYTMQRVEQ